MVRKSMVRFLALAMLLGLTLSDLQAQTRVNFARGRSSATVSGRLARGASRSYVLRARAGQMMGVEVRSGNRMVIVDIGGNDVGTGTNIRLRSTGDYILTTHNEGNATTYSMTVSIR